MIVRPIHTPVVTANNSVLKVIDAALPDMPDSSVLAVTSKIVSVCEGRIKPKSENLDTLISIESQQYIPRASSLYNIALTVKHGMLIPNAGIDKSNAKDGYILWPKNPAASACRIWKHLRKRSGVSHLGVIITDSTTMPLRWGVRGVAIAWCGFEPLKSYIGSKDLFGRKLRYTYLSVVDSLAASAVLSMGEGAEQTPLAIISEIPHIRFQSRPPNAKERRQMTIPISEDVFSPILRYPKWIYGKNKQAKRPHLTKST